jgi:hypothetical protein
VTVLVTRMDVVGGEYVATVTVCTVLVLVVVLVL